MEVLLLLFRLDVIETRLKQFFSPDIHTNDDCKYIVNSLYFDDFKNTCFYDVEAGNPERYKYRIRYYNNDLSFIKLERKEKLYGQCRKFCTNISLEQALKIINGEYYDVFWETDDKLLKRFLIDFINGNFKPKIITKYERCALEDKIKDIRITLDRQISMSLDFTNFLAADYKNSLLNEGNRCVVEIKFNFILPAYIKKLCYFKYMSRQTFSKYYIARKYITRIKQWNF